MPFWLLCQDVNQFDKNRILNLYYLEDKAKDFTVENLPDDKFIPANTAEPNFGLYNGYVWFKLRVGDIRGKTFYLEIKNPLLDEIELFTQRNGKWVSKGKSGDQIITDKKDGRFHQFVVKPNAELLVKVNNLGDELMVPMNIYSASELQDRNLREQFYLGIYFGIILFVSVANLFVLILLRERTNLYYFGYLVSIILLQIAIVGYGKAYFWPDQPYAANIAPPLLGSAAIFFSILFSQSILRMKRRMPIGFKILNVLAILALINIGISLIPNNSAYEISGIYVNTLSLISAIALIISGITSLRKGYKPARFFLLGFVLFAIFIVVFVLHNFGFLPNYFFTEYSLLVGSFCEIVCLSFALIDTFGLHKEKTLKTLVRINKLQNEQNANLEKGVKERTVQIQEKNRELELKSKEILDSIQYAKLIQKGMMQPEESFSNYFDDSFLIFKPKDIVSGDFYWLTDISAKNDTGVKKNYQVLCLADCTGHGVPGAIISVLGLRILNGVVKRRDVGSPSEALNALNEEFAGIFGEGNSAEALNNGMDAVICSVNKEDMTLQFAGAKNDLFLVRKGELMKLKGDRHSIGQADKSEEYKLSEITLEKGDCIYLTTDGYADQFGGEKNKKMKFTFFKGFISANYNLPMSEQKALIEKNLEDWIGENGDQTDDICVIGFRV